MLKDVYRLATNSWLCVYKAAPNRMTEKSCVGGHCDTSQLTKTELTKFCEIK